jgi:hypothetical protein
VLVELGYARGHDDVDPRFPPGLFVEAADLTVECLDPMTWVRSAVVVGDVDMPATVPFNTAGSAS